MRGTRDRRDPGASQEIANAARRRVALAARSGELGVTPEMLVAGGEQGFRDGSRASEQPPALQGHAYTGHGGLMGASQQDL